MLTPNMSEKERMHNWASQFSDRKRKEIFTEFVYGSKSYWNTRENGETYLMEYEPKTVTDFNSLLQMMWAEDETMREILKTVLVAIMKNEPTNEPTIEQGQVQLEKRQEELPEYIYNF